MTKISILKDYSSITFQIWWVLFIFQADLKVKIPIYTKYELYICTEIVVYLTFKLI